MKVVAWPRLPRPERALGPDVDPAVVAALRATRPPAADRFGWLRETASRANVFVTFLVGGGVIISGAAWLVDRVASQTATPGREHRLARRLGRIAYPPDGLLVDEALALAQDVPGTDDAQIRALLGQGGQR
jgi:hypothetical protein